MPWEASRQGTASARTMTSTAQCLPRCKLVMYANCGHNIDADLVEELTGEADRFLSQAAKNGKWYAEVL